MTIDSKHTSIDEELASSPLVTAKWLSQHLNSDNLVVLDATWTLPQQNRDPKAEFRGSHIPGAQPFDIDRITNAASPLPHMLPNQGFFEAEIGQLGIDSKTWVIVYDNNFFMASARVWWMFRVFGHERVRVLDGGLSSWTSQGLTLESGDPNTLNPKTFHATFRSELLVNLEQILMSLGSPRRQLVDARPANRFEGIEPEPRPGLRSGHIPGSHPLFFKDLLDADSGCLLPEHKIRAAFEGVGIHLDRPITATCGSGVTAAVLVLGLYCIGHTDAALYDGSFAEWGLDIGTPIETGKYGA